MQILFFNLLIYCFFQFCCASVVRVQPVGSLAGQNPFPPRDAFGLHDNGRVMHKFFGAADAASCGASVRLLAAPRFIYIHFFEATWSTTTCAWSGSASACVRVSGCSRNSGSTSCWLGTMEETRSWSSASWTWSRARTGRCASCSSRPSRRKMWRRKFQPVSLRREEEGRGAYGFPTTHRSEVTRWHLPLSQTGSVSKYLQTTC